MTEALSSLDREHDTLRSEADGKDETIQQLQQLLTDKVLDMYRQYHIHLYAIATFTFT